jgi:hypothetical protein
MNTLKAWRGDLYSETTETFQFIATPRFAVKSQKKSTIFVRASPNIGLHKAENEFYNENTQ